MYIGTVGIFIVIAILFYIGNQFEKLNDRITELEEKVDEVTPRESHEELKDDFEFPRSI